MRGLLAVVLLTACGSSPKPPAAPAPAPAPAPVEEDKPDEAEAKTAGILGAGPVEEGGAFASLTGTGDISSGFDDANIYGGLLGNEEDSWWSDGESSGGFGYGRSGFGPGQGGTGWGTIGTGRYGSIGHGSGTGSGYGVAPPEVRLGAFTAVGDLDKAIIRRYIKRNFAKIRYCYEK